VVEQPSAVSDWRFRSLRHA